MANLLLVDDDDDIRKLVEIILRGLRHKVYACASGAEALKILEREEYDILITDFVMPGMTGAELLDIVSKKYPALPVIIMSGTLIDDGSLTCPLLNKPRDIVPQTIRQTIDACLKR